MSQDAKLLIALLGYWGEHPEWSVLDWKYEVANNDTRQGYWDWVAAKLEEAKEDG